MAEQKADGVETGAVKAPRRRKQPEGVPFTTLTAKEAQKASIRARNLRKQMRAMILDAAIKEGIDKLFAHALKSGDIDQMTIIEKAMKLTGLDFATTEGVVAQLEAKTGEGGDRPTAIKFTLAKANVAVDEQEA